MRDSFHTAIRELIAEGATPERIEAEIVQENAELDDEQRAAIWLYAWSLRDTRDRHQLTRA